MAVAVVADAHLGGPGGGAESFVYQLDALPGEGCRRLVLLGDIFHVWVGSARFETPDIRAVADCLRRLRSQGLEIDYVEGNRDFFLDRGPYRKLFDRLSLEVSFSIAGRRFLAVHGDGLNDRDLRYRFWRWLSKSLLCRAVVLNLPAGFAQRFVSGTERRLGKTNFKHKAEIPEAIIKAYGANRLAEGYDALLLGHFHEPHRFEIAGGEVRVLDAWFRSRRVEWFR